MAVRPDVDLMIDFLNSLLEIDRDAIAALCKTRVICNEALLKHPSVQVFAIEGAMNRVGLLGILNGFYGVIEDGPHAGNGPIAAVFDKNELRRFQRTETT